MQVMGVFFMTPVTNFCSAMQKKRGKITPSVDDWRIFHRGNAYRKLSCNALGVAQRHDDVFCQPIARAVPPVQPQRDGLFFTGVGIGMACWFVTGLLGITLSELLLMRHEMWEGMKQGMLFMMANTPPDLQFT